MILAIRTDQPDAQICLLSKTGEQLATDAWEAGRRLSQELLPHIADLLASTERQLSDLTGIIVWKGPGSFTGLRIGITTANALAYSLAIAVVGTTDDDWMDTGLAMLNAGVPIGQLVLPEYGSEAHVTAPRK